MKPSGLNHRFLLSLLLIFCFLISERCFAAEDKNDQLIIKYYFNVMPGEMESYDGYKAEHNSSIDVMPDPKELYDLVKLGKPAVPALLKHLIDKDRYVSESAYYGLITITNKRFGRNSISQWKNWWLKNCSKSRVQWLIDDLSDPDENQRKSAIISIWESGYKSAIPALRKELKDPPMEFYAAEGLGNLGDKYSIPYILETLMVNDMDGFREDGIELLKNMTGKTFGFDPKGSPEARTASIAEWKKWWELNKEKYIQEK